MEKKDEESKTVELFQLLMTNDSFEPFGTFFSLGRHMNPIT